MITESYWWKYELYKRYKTIVQFISKKDIENNSTIDIELSIMICAYIIRKLNETEKIPPDFLKESIHTVKYSSKSFVIDHMNWWYIDKNYDLANTISENNNWNFFLNQIIHSFTFRPVGDKNGKLSGILINSDDTKDAYLYYLKIKDIIKLILKISEGDIVESHSHREIEIFDKGLKRPKEMKLISTKYGYPKDFNLDKIVNNSMQGVIFEREMGF
jgi:hypothetical protein